MNPQHNHSNSLIAPESYFPGGGYKHLKINYLYIIILGDIEEVLAL